MQLWRSAGWPHRDAIELDLLAAGFIEPVVGPAGHETLRLTASGLDSLAAARRSNRRSVGPHDRLAERVALKLKESGRLVWRELSLRARVDALAATACVANGALDLEGAAVDGPAPSATNWRMARPDVFSIRNTTVQTYLHPIVHEVKVSRADLLGDLRVPAKRQAYAWLCSECYYVFPEGIATPDEIPPDFGVWIVRGSVDEGALEQVRPARHSTCQLPFPVWMALAKSTPVYADVEDNPQAQLGPSAFSDDHLLPGGASPA